MSTNKSSTTPPPPPPSQVEDLLTSSPRLESATIQNSPQVTLQVCSRRFVTTRLTLITESGYFKTLLCNPWAAAPVADKKPNHDEDNNNNNNNDGCYFIDADADLFSHILRYLRRGVLPIFYDRHRGHDHALYVALLEEARYFQIDRLRRWLEEKHYLQAVATVRSAVEVEGLASLPAFDTTDTEFEYFPTWTIKKVYVCPRAIEVHRGKPGMCGRACHQAQGNAPTKFVDEMVLRTLVVRKRTVVDSQMCLAGR